MVADIFNQNGIIDSYATLPSIESGESSNYCNKHR